MNVILKQPDKQGIVWNFHCQCTHVAADHWYATGHGTIISGRCHQCPLDINIDKCKEFRPDNLKYLEYLEKVKKL